MGAAEEDVEEGMGGDDEGHASVDVGGVGVVFGACGKDAVNGPVGFEVFRGVVVIQGDFTKTEADVVESDC